MELLFVVLSSVTDARTRRANLERLAGRVSSAWLSDTDLEFPVDGAPYTRLRFKPTFGRRLRATPDGFWEPPDAGIQLLSAPELVAEGSCSVRGHSLGEGPRRREACATFGGGPTYACRKNP